MRIEKSSSEDAGSTDPSRRPAPLRDPNAPPDVTPSATARFAPPNLLPHHQIDQLVSAVRWSSKQGGISELETERVVAWARRVRSDAATLDLFLDGGVRVGPFRDGSPQWFTVDHPGQIRPVLPEELQRQYASAGDEDTPEAGAGPSDLLSPEEFDRVLFATLLSRKTLGLGGATEDELEEVYVWAKAVRLRLLLLEGLLAREVQIDSFQGSDPVWRRTAGGSGALASDADSEQQRGVGHE